MSQINIIDLTFAYEGSYQDIFRNVSFTIDTDWKLGFCGRNGRGKTTFLNLLLGKYEYQGKIVSSATFEYFPYEVVDRSRKVEDILMEVTPHAEYWQIQKEISLLDLEPSVLYQQFNTLSNGEQTKVLLAGLFLREHAFLLIDEPTNHLDLNARIMIARYLNKKKGFILVSHDRSLLDGCTDHTLSINKCNIDIISGNFSVWYKEKERRDAFERASNEALKKEIYRLEESIRRTSAWSDKAENSKKGFHPKKEVKMGWAPKQAAKSKKMMKRSKAIVERQEANIEQKSHLLKNIESTDVLKLFPLTYHTGNLLTIEALSVTYDTRTIFQEFNLTIQEGERVALQGKNGCGKSSIIKLLSDPASSDPKSNTYILHTGRVQIGSGLMISYVSQDTSSLSGTLTDFIDQSGIAESLCKAILRKLDFSREQFDVLLEDYSAGQKKKILIARSLCQRAHLYIWDEPLNYIDVLSRIQIEELILQYQPTLLFVEHDKVFTDHVATSVVEM